MIDRGGIPLWKLLAIGAAAGVTSGLLGIGGGIIMVPLLLAIGMDRHRAHATSLAAIIPIALAGSTAFGVSGAVDLRVGVAVGLGGVLGSALGATVMNRTAPRTLAIVFDLVLLIAALRMIFGGGSLTSGAGLEGFAVLALAFAIGSAAGFFAGLSGVGGGVIMVPAFVLLLGFTQHAAQGTSLVAIIFTALSGTTVNLRNRRVQPIQALTVGLAGVAGSIGGARVALGVEARALSLTFGLLALYVAGQSLYKILRTQ